MTGQLVKANVVRFIDLEEIPAAFTYMQFGIRFGDIEDPDLRARAEAIEPDNERCQQCDQAVGVVLAGDDDRATWRWVTIAADDKGTWLLCEECSDALAYGTAHGAKPAPVVPS